MKKVMFLIIILYQSAIASGQSNKVIIPDFNDKYSKYVRQLESGDTKIDYTDFRSSFLESKQFAQKHKAYDSLKRQLFDEATNGNYNRVIALAVGMLNVDYTSMTAHKFLQQTYTVLKDSNKAAQYHDIEFGLLYSIVRSGDGKSCASAWPVTQIEEEYFILQMIGARMESQSIDGSGEKVCDRMEVVLQDGEQKDYYFEISKILEATRKQLQK